MIRLLCLWCGEWTYESEPAFVNCGYVGNCGKIECTSLAFSGEEKIAIATECISWSYPEPYSPYPDNMGNY